jgi:3',5'-cyclic AMP phosphodiesterase CpdA
VLLAQITDLHVSTPGSNIDRQCRTAARLEQALQHLSRMDPRPDAVLCTGDLVDNGKPEEYAVLAPLLASLPMPCFLIPGNHDHRENLRAAFAHHGYLPRQGFLQYTVDLGPLRLIALDTLVEDDPNLGRLGPEQLAWLDARLAEAPERPTLVMMHHPPFRTGIQRMDAMGLDGIAGMAEVIRRHPQVERIVSGHLHRPIVKRFAGTVASTCPGTAHQVVLDLRRPGRLAIVDEPPACQLHLWSEELGLVSHTSYIPAPEASR